MSLANLSNFGLEAGGREGAQAIIYVVERGKTGGNDEIKGSEGEEGVFPGETEDNCENYVQISVIMSEKRTKPPPPPKEMRHFLSQNWRIDLLFLGLGVSGAVGVVLYGYFSSIKRQKRLETGQFTVEVPFFDQNDEENE